MRYLSLKVIKTIKINDKEVGDTLHSSVQSLFQLVSINSLREKTFAIDSNANVSIRVSIRHDPDTLTICV